MKCTACKKEFRDYSALLICSGCAAGVVVPQNKTTSGKNWSVEKEPDDERWKVTVFGETVYSYTEIDALKWVIEKLDQNAVSCGCPPEHVFDTD